MADKFKALVHYICHRMSDDPARLGLTKLNKILWYSDVWMYKKRGLPITGEGTQYIKQAWGPVAKSLLPVLTDLHRDQIVVGRREEYPGGTHVKFFSLEEPDLSDFSAEEISIIEYVIDQICYEHTAKSISDLSHDLTWRMHEIGEKMPLYRSHVMELGEVTDEDMAWARHDQTGES
jgi:hypothetical protein